MNGNLEFSDESYPLELEFQGTKVPVFNATPDSLFWVVGGANNEGAAMPRVFHYSEGEHRSYIDLANLPIASAVSATPLIPDNYKEAFQYKAQWLKSAGPWQNPSKQFNRFGSDELPTRSEQLTTEDFESVKNGLRTFDTRMPYACYNWEVFFHGPLLVADQLSKQHKFEEAERWLRYVFDPTSGEAGGDAKSFLKFRVFNELDTNNTVTSALNVLAQAAAGLHAADDQVADVQELIDRWRDAPFRPFLIARRRHIAFLWRTLFAYLDNLIAWADSLYRRDTRESINEATLLYVLAARILGPRPKLTTASSRKPPKTYAECASQWDDFANLWLDASSAGNAARDPWVGAKATAFPKAHEPQVDPRGFLLFCIPINDKLFGYWDTVGERLFNIRHCRNMEGITRDLPLTDPPIDPELLVRATAAGLDIGDVISGLYAPPPHYRYNVLAARAGDLANEAKALGSAMLSAIEKRDAESLSLLRSSNEIALLRVVSELRVLQIDESESNLVALRASRRSIESRYRQYQRLLGKTEVSLPGEQETTGEESMLGAPDAGLASGRSNLGLINEENQQYVGFEGAATWGNAAGISKQVSAGLELAAGIVSAAGGDTAYKVVHAVALGASLFGDGFSFVAQGWRNHAEHQGMLANHLRRRDEWAFQSNQTLKELQQLDKQILANEIRIQITKKERLNHIQQIEQAQAVDEVMRSKFSNAELYGWMVTNLSAVHFGAYRMAHELALSAQRAAVRELGSPQLNIIRQDYWDSPQSGLLAGDRLGQDIKRLEVEYLKRNMRELEITKHISLRQLAPAALMALRAGGQCEFEIPEWLFDMDFPGHYFRRIKSVSLSIPSVVGPYTGVNGTLTLLSSKLRESPTVRDGGEYGAEENYQASHLPVQSIATSTGQNDAGMFELNFRDERYLPFEGAGAVASKWRLSLPDEFRAFDYDTISDVVLHVKYTARASSGDLKRRATTAVRDRLKVAEKSPLYLMIGLRLDFPTEWARVKSAGGTDPLPIQINDMMYPAIFQGGTKTLDDMCTLWTKIDGKWQDLLGQPTASVPSGKLAKATDAFILVGYKVTYRNA